jgi:putative transposase
VKFGLVDAEKASFPVAAMCGWLGISRSGYYAWCKSRKTSSTRKENDAVLLVEIRAVHREHRQRYGSPRVYRELRSRGRRIGRKRIERLMRSDGLRARMRRRFILTTDSRGTKTPAPNRLARDFHVRRPNRAWVGDVTYIPTATGWLYLAILLDIGSRRIVGWALSKHNDTELALTALRRALASRRVPRRLLHHTDRGTPYASLQYQLLLRKHGVVASMSRKGNCWDNAVAESFFSTLKTELVDGPFASQAQAHQQIGRYIDGYYNLIRLHSALDYVSPATYEATYRT